jgi:ubiquinone/menaquinone biosynthesis C-methylase UbiE
MQQERVVNSETSTEKRVCPWQHVRTFDNLLRPLIHNPRKLFGPYVRRGMTVLDVGCGRGFASLGLARQVGDNGLVISADLQPQMLEMVKERAAKAGLSSRIRVHRCEASRVGVQEKLDFAVAFWMVHEVPDERAFLSEIFGLLKPGGRLFVAEPKIHTSRPDFEQLVQKSQNVGFVVSDRPHVFLSRAVLLSKEV